MRHCVSFCRYTLTAFTAIAARSGGSPADAVTYNADTAPTATWSITDIFIGNPAAPANLAMDRLVYAKSDGITLTFDAPAADVASDYAYTLDYFPVYNARARTKVVSSSTARSAVVRQVAGTG